MIIYHIIPSTKKKTKSQTYQDIDLTLQNPSPKNTLKRGKEGIPTISIGVSVTYPMAVAPHDATL
jgi:hypothetical protein